MTKQYPIAGSISSPRLLPAILLFCLVQGLCGAMAFAQENRSAFGRHFLVAFPDTAHHRTRFGNVTPVRPTGQIILFSFETARVRIRMKNYDREFIVDPSSATVVTPEFRMLERVGLTSQDVYEITSDRDISVYMYYTTPFGTEAFTALPVSSWGKEYYVMGLPRQGITHIAYTGDEEGFADSSAPAQLVVLASELTYVTVQSTALIGESYNRTYELLAGDALLLEADTSSISDGDLSGTRIIATRPVGVISGNTRAYGLGFMGFPPGITSPMTNSIIEWLRPVESHGSIFAYRQLSPVEEWRSFEFVRIYATAPGATTVIDGRTGVPIVINQGEFVEYPCNDWIKLYSVPFIVTTDRPAQAMVVSAPYSKPYDSLTLESPMFDLWGPAMSELMPHERWLSFARFHAPDYPPFTKHYVTIVADTTAEVFLDGVKVAFDPQIYPRFPYRQVRIEVKTGDHSILAGGGRFSAIAFGQGPGFQEYRPVKSEKEDDPSPLRPHPSKYSERFVTTYAYPVTGIEKESETDSLAMTQFGSCDSLVVVARRADGYWLRRSISAWLDTASRNADVLITPIIQWGDTVGYTIRFRPVNPALDASGRVVLTSGTRRWEIPYRYEYPDLGFVPDPVERTGVQPGVTQTIDLTVYNRRSQSAMIRAARLLHGGRGFVLPRNLPFPRTLAGGDSVRFSIDFITTFTGSDYRDTIVIEMACGSVKIPMRMVTIGPPPSPLPWITGCDWRDRWLSTLNACTKSGIRSYDSLIWIGNAGAAPYLVRSLALIGADADSGYFVLGSNPVVRLGDRIDSGARIPQHVIFRPKDEREYSCSVRLITISGDTLFTPLHGIGIESHIRVTDLDFGSIPFIGAGATKASGSITLTADPTRPLTVRSLRIAGADAAEFGFADGFSVPDASDASTWWRLAVGESRQIPLVFAPSAAGERQAYLEAEGDHSLCDDSVGVLRGVSHTTAAEGRGYDFGVMAACGDSVGDIVIGNRGSVGMRVSGIELEDTSGAFAIDIPRLPVMLGAGEELRVAVRFMPTESGSYRGVVRVAMRSVDGVSDYGTIEAEVRGVSERIKGVVYIDRRYRAFPGQPIITDLVLEQEIDRAGVRELELRIDGRNGMMLLKDRSAAAIEKLLDGTLLEGWSVTIEPSGEDTLYVRLRAPSGEQLRDSGTLLKLEWATFLGDSMQAELPFDLKVAGIECAEIETRAGHARLDSICGLRYRLITLVSGEYALEGNRPNPFNPVTEIAFSLGLDGSTRVEVYDEMGRLVDLLVDKYLRPGKYVVEWDGGDRASGVYTYRIISGEWRAMGRMVLAK